MTWQAHCLPGPTEGQRARPDDRGGPGQESLTGRTVLAHADDHAIAERGVFERQLRRALIDAVDLAQVRRRSQGSARAATGTDNDAGRTSEPLRILRGGGDPAVGGRGGGGGTEVNTV